jgi:hypothetical protein
MSRPTPPKPDRLSDPVYKAAQRIVALGEGWTHLTAPPEGKVLWREDGDEVRLTPDGWLVYLNGGKAGLYAKGLRATPDLVATMRGNAHV